VTTERPGDAGTGEAGRFVMAAIHPVRDFAQFFAAVDRYAPQGMVCHRLYRSLDDPTEVMSVVEFSSAEAAAAAIPDPDLREALDRAGIDVYPALFVGEIVDVPEAQADPA
jgi:hypothetical protein